MRLDFNPCVSLVTDNKLNENLGKLKPKDSEIEGAKNKDTRVDPSSMMT